MATEICYITLKPGIDLESSTPEAKIWQDGLKIISSQDGYIGQYWGHQLENPDVLMLVIGPLLSHLLQRDPALFIG